MPPNFLPPELQIENDAINRRRQLANALLQQGLTQDNGQMVGNIFVRPSPLQGLAKLFSVYAGVKGGRDADEQLRDLVQKHNQMTQDWIGSAPRPTTQTQELEGPTMGGGPLTGSQTVNPTQQDMMQWAMKGMNVNPQIAGSMVSQFLPQKPVVVGRSLIDPSTGQVKGVDQTWQAEQKAARDAKMIELETKLEDRRLAAADRATLQRELAQMQIDARRDMAGLAASLRQPQAPVAVVGPDGKPTYVAPGEAYGKTPWDKKDKPGQLPTPALKLQQEEMDALSTSATLNADIGALKQQVDTGALKLGPLSNAIGTARNFAGMSDENSRNLASFRANIEKLRNDSLRLNKGVQTEGDAVRAMNEIMANINDPKVVSQRLDELRRINERAINLRKNNIEIIRSNYGAGPMDTSGVASQPAAVGPQSAPAPSGFRVVR